MRLFRVVVAAALVAAVSGVSPLLAKSAGWVSGHAVDAVGHPLPNLRVELLKAFRGQPRGVPLRAHVTDGRGAWSFDGVAAGDYVVRMVYDDRSASVPVSVTEASGTLGVLIVAPSLPPARFSQGDEDDAVAPWLARGSNALAVAGAVIAAAAATSIVLVVRDDKS